jgi:hypothetical protein
MYEQEKVYRKWSAAADGDLDIVERALQEAIANAEKEQRPATSSEVLAAIERLRAKTVAA